MTPVQNTSGRAPLIIVGTALAVLIVVFTLVFVVASEPPQGVPPIEPVSATAYRARVDALLAGADPARAEAALAAYGCVACHRAGAANGVAPAFEGIAARAAERRPPMPADAYLYESIIHPEAYTVEEFSNAMPRSYGAQISDQALGDIIAYLLQPDAR
jgi:mono/diheme cytochrome c family protein